MLLEAITDVTTTRILPFGIFWIVSLALSFMILSVGSVAVVYFFFRNPVPFFLSDVVHFSFTSSFEFGEFQKLVERETLC